MSRFAHSTKIAAIALAGVALAGSFSTPSEARSRYHRHHNGGAVAAGIIGGLVVGGLAAAAARDYYEPRRAYRPAYAYGPRYGYGYGDGYGYRRYRPRCWVQTQTFYNRWGRPYYRDVEVCR